MSIDLDDPRLTAYALGELDDAAEIAAVEALLRAHPEVSQVVEEIRATGDLLRRELATEHEALPVADLTIRHAVEKALRPRPQRLPWGMLSIAASTLILGGTTFLWMSTQSGEARRAGAPSMAVATAEAPKSGAGSAADSAAPAILAEAATEAAPAPSSRQPEPGLQLAQADRGRTEPFYARSNGAPRAAEESAPPAEHLESEGIASLADESMAARLRRGSAPGEGFGALARAPAAPAEALPELAKVEMRAALAPAPAPVAAPPPPSPVLAAPATAPAPAPGAITLQAPPAMIAAAPAPVAAPAAPMPGQTQLGMRVTSALDAVPPPPPPVPAAPGTAPAMIAAAPAPVAAPAPAADNFAGVPPPPRLPASGLAAEVSPKTRQLAIAADREAFAPLVENPFVRVLEQPQSTFALDVDTASYAIVRRYLMSQNALPPKDAVRIEEMVNAFRYDDPAPSGDDPVAVQVEIARSPWSDENRLARIALTGRTIAPKDRPRANLVFLIDVSGSMDEPDKLPLLKRGMRMLTEQLGEGDRVAIVTYSNTARVALPPTRGDQQREILSALESLTPGGSTNGAGGLNLAYEQAGAAFIEDGANRVILASDGDFNVGETDNNALVNLIQEKAKSRIFLTVLGFGRGNLQDARLEALADKGNGHYHYIDSPREARRVLVQQVSGTLVTVAKDVKIQVDFNPTKVGAYRLIGFENRLLPASAFRDDTKDGGELGAGHAVCALYELIPSGKEGKLPAADAPQFVKPAAPADPNAPESFVVKLAFKPPDGDISTTRSIPAVDAGKDYAEASRAFRWASAVASFGQILRESSYRGTATLDGVLELAESARGDDPKGDRKEFLDLVRKAKELGAK